MPYAVETCFAEAWPARSWCDSHVVLAVSAGPDSVAMLRAAMVLKREAGGSGGLFVAHLNHGLRGRSADSDEAWLRKLCLGLNVPLEVGKFDVTQLAAEQGDGIEAAARTARYDFLRQTAERLGARFVATAHTADDQVETILHRILRGTGLAGLTGIPGTRPLSPSVTLVRPLLEVRRRDVLYYLERIGQDSIIDPTNMDPRFTRNRLRYDLLPILRDNYNADVDAALLRLSAQAAAAQQLIADLAAWLSQECVTIERNKYTQVARIECSSIATQNPLVIGEVCKVAWDEAGWPRQAMGFDHWQQLADLITGSADSAPANLPGNIRARREGQRLILERLDLA